MDKVEDLIKGNIEHLHRAALHFENLVKTQQDSPVWYGYFRVAGKLSIEIQKRYPVTIPEMTEWPTDEKGEDLPWTHDDVQHWKDNDPYMRWNRVYDDLVATQYDGSRINTRIAVHRLQQTGKDLI